MGHENGSSASFNNVKESTQGLVDTVGITYLAFFDDIVVESYENDLAVKVCVLDERDVMRQYCGVHTVLLFNVLDVSRIPYFPGFLNRMQEAKRDSRKHVEKGQLFLL